MFGAALRPLLTPSSNLYRTAVRNNLVKPTCLPVAQRFTSVRFASSGPRFSDDHEWITVDENNIGTVGITDYAQKALGDVVYVEVAAPGDTLEQGGFMGSVESVKAASDIYSPVSGTLASVNEALKDQPSLLNKDPMGKGWVCKIQLSDPAQVETLMDDAGYKAFCESDPGKDE
ncbi:glycine cleavage system H protein [Kockovaella imperatae]|uniref:Glycine cleavage system H protein n=1 Tax=Kockovaella imperatae TaxID=4999 RepID=A0A1Y1UGF7_9TREE|nr:glycine cleavage system H protein [Kockovaella imperatae]ORX37112.1 glycine cleavage system H protein [Kockovaella imperatae]